MFGLFSGFFSNDIAIDLGTANTLIYVSGKGIVLDEPSVVAIRHQASRGGSQTIRAVGNEAKLMLGRTPANIQAIRPMKDGVIADFTVTEQMLRHFIKKVHDTRFFVPSPRIVICVPCGSTQVERRAIRESAYGAGARRWDWLRNPRLLVSGPGFQLEDAPAPMSSTFGGGRPGVVWLPLGGGVITGSGGEGGVKLGGAAIN